MSDSELKEEIHSIYVKFRDTYGFSHPIPLSEGTVLKVKLQDFGFINLYLSQVMLNKKYGTFEVGLGALLRIDKIEKHFEPYINALGLTAAIYKQATTIQVSAERAYPGIIAEPYFSNHFLRFEASLLGLKKFEETLVKLSNERIIPSILSYNDIPKLDRIINTQFRFTNEVNDIFVQNMPVFFKRLIIARYADNLNYLEYCKKTAEIVEKNAAGPIDQIKPELARYPDTLDELIMDLSKIKPE